MGQGHGGRSHLEARRDSFCGLDVRPWRDRVVAANQNEEIEMAILITNAPVKPAITFDRVHMHELRILVSAESKGD